MVIVQRSRLPTTTSILPTEHNFSKPNPSMHSGVNSRKQIPVFNLTGSGSSLELEKRFEVCGMWFLLKKIEKKDFSDCKIFTEYREGYTRT